jgi:hypothetical protein
LANEEIARRDVRTKETVKVEMVDAVVVRSSYWAIEDGVRREVRAGQGKDSHIRVPKHHLVAFNNVLVSPNELPAEVEKVAAEGLQAPTTTGEAVGPTEKRR